MLLLAVPAAEAHTDLVSSTPAVGAHVKSLPSQVRLEFAENLLALGSGKTNVVIVRDPQGRKIDRKNSQLNGRFLSVGIFPSTFIGYFTVSWRVVSGDGHPAEGSFKFSVGNALKPSPASTLQVEAPQGKVASLGYAGSAWDRYGSRILLFIGALIAFLIWMRFKQKKLYGRKDGGSEGE